MVVVMAAAAMTEQGQGLGLTRAESGRRVVCGRRRREAGSPRRACLFADVPGLMLAARTRLASAGFGKLQVDSPGFGWLRPGFVNFGGLRPTLGRCARFFRV